MKRLRIALLALLAGCQAAPASHPSLKTPPEWWQLGFTVPDCMDAWVEWAAAEDIQGRIFNRIGSGLPAYNCPGNTSTEIARGWQGPGVGGRQVPRADLPRRIYVRWQSIVERKTYRAWIEIPEQARALMRTSQTQTCPNDPNFGIPGIFIHLGLAPGGAVVVWVRDPCLSAIQVASAQAEEEPLGPHQGESKGHYYPQKEASKRYVERFGIPYGSW